MPRHFKAMWEPRSRTPRPWFFSKLERDPYNPKFFFWCVGIGALLLRYCNPAVEG